MLKRFLNIFLSGLFISLTMAGCAQSDSAQENTSGDTPDKVVLTDVDTTSAGDIVLVGETEQINAVALFSDGTTQDVTSKSDWSTSDDTVAKVDTNGLVTGISEGNATITVSYSKDGVDASSNLVISVYTIEPAFKSGEIHGADTINVEFTTDLDAYATFDDDSVHHVDDRVNWSSSNDAIATVDKNGVVRGISEGNVTITVKGKVDNTKTATHKMYIGKLATGTLVERNIIWDFDDKLVLSDYKTHATGQTGNNTSNPKRYGVWYFHEVGYGFEEDQTVGETYFAFEATKNGTLDSVLVDVYVNNGVENKNVKIGVTLDADALRYPTWADFKVDHADWTIRTNYTEKGEGRFLRGNFFLRLGHSGYELKEDFEISKFIVVKVPTAGMIVKDNIIGTTAPINITNSGLSADGSATGQPVWYYIEVGNSFMEGQKVKNTGFDFKASSQDAAPNVYVNVYLNDGTGTIVGNHKVTLGSTNDPANDRFSTWDGVIAKYPESTLRNYWETPVPGKRIRGNFYLRIGDSTYTGTGQYFIDKFIIVHK